MLTSCGPSRPYTTGFSTWVLRTCLYVYITSATIYYFFLVCLTFPFKSMCLFNFNLLQEETVLPYYKQKAGIACHKECKAKWEENTARPLNSSQTAVPAGIPKHQPCPLCERGGPPVARKVVGVLYQIVVLIGRLGRDPRGDSCPLT